MRLKMAQHGERRPLYVLAGNYQAASGVCPWWDATKLASQGGT